MTSIKVLSSDLINKIAAGEVIERPASVVKELVENSIDAGATQIVVEIGEAGKKLIRVADNGCGLTEAEIKLALQRHSTSKISSYDDLFNIHTLGFRGEALPSIDSVSRMKITPNPAKGLTVEVKDLFYNTPARKKFLKANSTETGHIGEVVAKSSLSNPQIAFKFISDGKTLINTPGTGKLSDAILAIYGCELAKELVEVAFDFPAGKVYGFVSRPTISRIDKNYETFFVNKRYVRNFLLNRALEEAYRTLIPGNRYPAAVLFIEIDPARVDVNVHPAKREVKFVKNQEVMDAVRGSVSKALEARGEGIGSRTERESERLPEFPSFVPDTLPNFHGLGLSNLSFPPSFSELLPTPYPLSPIHQFKLTYIVATDGEELVLIDQHAAHERILYDRLSNQELGDRGEGVESQFLLVPETLEFNVNEAGMLKDNLDYLKKIGFDIEEFGNNSFILRAVPAVASKLSVMQFIQDIAAELGEIGKSVQIEVKQERIRKYLACHSAIKAGDKLDQTEINQLIKDLFATQNPLTCPHGRPTMVRLSEAELAKRFGR
ncbi:MAG: DNA mismatch repair endonuclease MutL [bacterium]